MTQHKWTRRAMMSGMGVGALQLTNARPAAAQASEVAFKPSRHPQDAWISNMPGGHRTIIDSVSAKGVGEALLFARNLFVANASGYGLKDSDLAIIVCLRHAGTGFAFNDAMWAKYGLSEYTGLKDATGKPYARNPFHRPTANELHLLMQAMQTPTIPMFAGAMPALGIESLQKMGTTFLVCGNALGAWCGELEARGKGTAADLQKELTANLLPGVTLVPAMVIAIEQAQNAGIAYNRQ